MIDPPALTDLELLLMSLGIDDVQRRTLNVRTDREFLDITHAVGGEIYRRDPSRGINGLLDRIMQARKP